MATEQITHVTPAFLQHWITFVKAHEKLLVAALAGFLVFHISSKGIDAWVTREQLKANSAAQVVQVDTSVTDGLKAQIAQLQTTVETQNAALNAKISQTQTATKKQQQTDATLPLTDLGSRIALLAQLQPQEVTTTPTQVTLSQPAAVSVAQQLELVPALQTEVASLNTIAANDNAIIGKQGDLITQLNKDVTDAKAQDVADVKQLKAQNKKSFLRGLKIGAIGGFIAGVFVGHGL